MQLLNNYEDRRSSRSFEASENHKLLGNHWFFDMRLGRNALIQHAFGSGISLASSRWKTKNPWMTLVGLRSTNKFQSDRPPTTSILVCSLPRL